MTPEEREDLRELIRQEPALADTFSAVDAEHAAATAHAQALTSKRDELLGKLKEISEAKEQLAPSPKASSAAASPREDSSVETSHDAEDSPVADETADQAKDRISRMRSAEKLNEIISNDPRVTVVEAAKKRLEEIG